MGKFSLPKLEFNTQELRDFFVCPRRFRLKYVDRLVKPKTFLGFEVLLHPFVAKIAIRDCLSCEEHIAMSEEMLRNNETHLVARDKVHDMDRALFNARLIAKTWDRVESKALGKGPFKTSVKTNVKIGRYTVRAMVDLYGGYESYYVKSIVGHNKERSNADTFLGLAEKAFSQICPTTGKRRKRLGQIVINLATMAKRPIYIPKRKFVWNWARSRRILGDCMDMINASVFPRLNGDSCWCTPVFCEYWDVCWDINRASRGNLRRDDL